MTIKKNFEIGDPEVDEIQPLARAIAPEIAEAMGADAHASGRVTLLMCVAMPSGTVHVELCSEDPSEFGIDSLVQAIRDLIGKALVHMETKH